MLKRIGLVGIILAASPLWMPFAFIPYAQAQQTLGGITGSVTDKTGSVLPDTVVTIVGDQTKLTRTQKTNANGIYDFVNLPIGTFTLTFTHDGFQTQKIPSIAVQANRTATVNAVLPVGQVGTVVEVRADPLMNAVDTTNGYVLDDQQIQAVPLPTGSFTGLAILSPGVNAELPGGTGANSGLGNQPIWANGQRDTSNSFLLNGVDASNLFNGKSTSQVASSRIVNNTGVSAVSSTTAAPVQSTASVYLAVGQALPTPAPETVQEVRVNTSMYDAQQGATSGAHIDMSTASGTNAIHGEAYWHRGTDWLNAAPFFNKQDPNIPPDQAVPELHREVVGGKLGGALIKNKLFGFVGYQHLHTSDQDIGLSRLMVPIDFNPTYCGTSSRQGAAFSNCLVNIANNDFLIPNNYPAMTAAQINSVALALFQYQFSNGQYLVPWSNYGVIPTPDFPENATIPGTAFFTADQAVADLDWNKSPRDTVSAKYYYQHDPTSAPYAFSNVAGFTQHLDAGSQVASLTNTQALRPNLSVVEVLGILREKVYNTIAQPFTPQQMNINTFGSTYFPGISIVNILTGSSPVPNDFLDIGQGAASQGAFTGVFQNRIMPSANAIWMRGKHTLTFGGSYAYTQLNTRDQRTNQGIIASADFGQFLQGFVTTNDDYTTTKFLQGNANRYYRAGQSGAYLQDKFQFRPNLSLTAGLRWDWDGGLTEKYGRIYNFDPSLYSYNGATDTLTSNGLIIAGNNSLFPTKGVSKTTLTGRQWGFAPRLGVAWSPKYFNDKVVVRAGTGIYYDRGELFSYLSPGFAEGVINGGPFGVNQTPPFVNAQACSPASESFYLNFAPTCPSPAYSLSSPWGASLGPAPTGNPKDIDNYLPNTGVPGVGIEQGIFNGEQLFSFATYNRANKLPYTINNTLDIQWQPRRDLAIDIGYVGNLGRHGVIPIPFNQPGIATPTHILHPNSPYPQQYTYGYTVTGPSNCNPNAVPPIPCNPINLPNNQGPFLTTYEGGNVDLRVPYIGYSAESESYTAAGVSQYNALQTHVEKRMSHGLQVGFSYTYSHALDEQSGMGLFFNGNNPLNLRSAYGSSDFDRTHVFNFSYNYELPRFFPASTLKAKVANGWGIHGSAVLQSGQPYSVIDYTGAVGSIFYSVYNGITNPIVPLKAGCTPKSALTGYSGANAYYNSNQTALNPNCFTLPLLNPGDLGGAIPPNDTFETNFTNGLRNVFRQSWQRVANVSFVKVTPITERYSLNYSLDIFNLTNTASFDVPIDDVSQNQYYNQFPVVGATPLPTGCTTKNPTPAFYNCPASLGAVNKTIGSPRQIQMTLRVVF
ncbi:MAG TPA: carboxypeptidase regulatory-like domain-containing protein [Terriglobales bacterium]|nr:carboxypeptidase regulatory-like domain-containing protein [Terriglobales bacterium]